MSLPPNLESTADLVRRAFPEGVTEADYLPLLTALYPHMSDRSLAMVVGHFVGQDYPLVLNDIYGVGGGYTSASPDAVAAVQARLVAAGLEEWLKEN
ncbi:DUF3349 domain-containing protein [Corallococcus exercitus]|uniref:DUF3349 domain-containing protein n=1 Tax=Corallococcus exercitus TaxID=2316736 RepID=A0A7Y4KLZ4_9BACT|nr:DUF3349 domain-containing protein [Corallococcus exercitus]NOK36257.1 DUF3349 domain-containing protein [Corallococcus exercitus]